MAALQKMVIIQAKLRRDGQLAEIHAGRLGRAGVDLIAEKLVGQRTRPPHHHNRHGCWRAMCCARVAGSVNRWPCMPRARAARTFSSRSSTNKILAGSTPRVLMHQSKAPGSGLT